MRPQGAGLVVPADDHPLSSTRGMAAVVISPAVQLRHAGGAAETEDAFRLLSRACASFGGRVHLTKHVFAEPDVLDEMYGEGMTRFRRARVILDPHRLFGSPFLERLEHATAARPAAIRPAPASGCARPSPRAHRYDRGRMLHLAKRRQQMRLAAIAPGTP